MAKSGGTYVNQLTSAAQRDLRRIAKNNRQAFLTLDEAINALQFDPRPPGVKHLGGRTHRKRVGDFRIIYDIDDEHRLVIIGRVSDRKDAYRR